MRIRQIRRTTAFILDGGFTLKKAMKSFTFWCLIISVFEIFMHQIGQDSKSIVLIGFNPILNIISDSQGFLYNFMGSGGKCHVIRLPDKYPSIGILGLLLLSRFMALFWMG